MTQKCPHHPSMRCEFCKIENNINNKIMRIAYPRYFAVSARSGIQ
jgi:hypothetical protein